MVPKLKVNTITFIDIIHKKESSLKRLKKQKDVPTLVELEEQGD
jgi:hypothetical protein